MADVKQFSSDKILKHLDRVNEWLKTGASRPINAELDMTNICNNKCPDCFVYLKDQSSIDLKTAKTIIDQIKDLGVKAIVFTGGGEPLCNKYTVEAIDYAKKKGLDVALTTNLGLPLTEKQMEILLRSCTWLRVSLDAGTTKVYAKTHGVDKKNFDKVVENTRKLVEIKKKIKSDCTIGVGFLTSELTKGGMLDATKLSKKLGVDYIQFRPFLKKFGEGGKDYEKTKWVYDEIEKCLSLADKNFDVLFSKHKYDKIMNDNLEFNYGKCYGNNFDVVIGADQKVYLCCNLRCIDKFCLGDLKKNTLKEIWNSEQRKQVTENINLNECTPLCRCDTFNEILWNLKQPKEHVNFI